MTYRFRGGATALATLLAFAATPPAIASQYDVQMLDHVFRRFAFSAPPEYVNAWLNASGGAWLTAANNWLANQRVLTIDKSSVPIQPPPAAPVSWSSDDYDYEDGYIEHTLGTNQQLRAKLELHWLDMFSVTGLDARPPSMFNYHETLWKNALGNFQTLLTAVAETPAELLALNNNGNNGANPATSPNLNFAREVMQIFSMGPVRLNMDGSNVLSVQGAPIPNYGQGDILTLAYAMSGYTVTKNASTTNALLQLYTTIAPDKHYSGSPSTLDGYSLTTFLGKSFLAYKASDPIAAVVAELAHNPSTAPFQAKQLLQRFVTEHPSAGYVSRIANVWAANVDNPSQIAVVMNAILNDSEFPSSYQSMAKQPIEKAFAFLRQLPGTFAPLIATTPGGATTESGANWVRWWLSAMGQNPYYPVDVFSFYPIGQVEQASTAIAYVQWLQWSSFVAAAPTTTTGLWIDIPTLRARIAAANKVAPSAITGVMAARYLGAAMIDANPAVVDQYATQGGPANNPIIEALRAVRSQPTDNQLRQAVWLIAASPEYNVN